MTYQGDYFRVFCILQMQYVDQVKKIKNYKRSKILYPEYKQREKRKWVRKEEEEKNNEIQEVDGVGHVFASRKKNNNKKRDRCNDRSLFFDFFLVDVARRYGQYDTDGAERNCIMY